MKPRDNRIARYGYRVRKLTVLWGDMSAAPGPQDDDTGWKRIPGDARTIHYKSGPVLFVEVRPVDTDERRPLACGSTLVLDPEREWEVKAPVNLYAATDLALRTTASPEPADALNFPCELLIDVEPGYAATPDVGASFEVLTTFGDAGSTVLDIPIRGLKKGFIFESVLAQTGTLVTSIAVVTIRPRAADAVGQPVTAEHYYAGALGASLSFLSPTAFREVFPLGEDFYNSAGVPVAKVWGLSPLARVHGYADRLRIDVFPDGAAGDQTIRFAYVASEWNMPARGGGGIEP